LTLKPSHKKFIVLKSPWEFQQFVQLSMVLVNRTLESRADCPFTSVVKRPPGSLEFEYGSLTICDHLTTITAQRVPLQAPSRTFIMVSSIILYKRV